MTSTSAAYFRLNGGGLARPVKITNGQMIPDIYDDGDCVDTSRDHSPQLGVVRDVSTARNEDIHGIWVITRVSGLMHRFAHSDGLLEVLVRVNQQTDLPRI